MTPDLEQLAREGPWGLAEWERAWSVVHAGIPEPYWQEVWPVVVKLAQVGMTRPDWAAQDVVTAAQPW